MKIGNLEEATQTVNGFKYSLAGYKSMFTALAFVGSNTLKGAIKNYRETDSNKIGMFTLDSSFSMSYFSVDMTPSSSDHYDIVADSIFYYESIGYLGACITSDEVLHGTSPSMGFAIAKGNDWMRTAFYNDLSVHTLTRSCVGTQGKNNFFYFFTKQRGIVSLET